MEKMSLEAQDLLALLKNEKCFSRLVKRLDVLTEESKKITEMNLRKVAG